MPNRKWEDFQKGFQKCDTRGGSYQLLRFKWRGARWGPGPSYDDDGATQAKYPGANKPVS